MIAVTYQEGEWSWRDENDQENICIKNSKKLANCRKEINCPSYEEPCRDSNHKSDQWTNHSFFRLIYSWTITSDTRVDLHLYSMIYKRKYSNRTSNTEKHRDNIDYNKWNSIHINISFSEFSFLDTEDVIFYRWIIEIFWFLISFYLNSIRIIWWRSCIRTWLVSRRSIKRRVYWWWIISKNYLNLWYRYKDNKNTN